MKYGFLFGAGAEAAYGLPSGGKFALEIFRHDTAKSKEAFKNSRDNVDTHTAYANTEFTEFMGSDPIKNNFTYHGCWYR